MRWWRRRVVPQTIGIGLLVSMAGLAADAGIERRPFGTTPEGDAVDLYTLQNRNGAKAQIADYGGTVVSLHVPDRDGRPGDVVLGFDSLDEYISDSPYFGCIVGRYGNRIAKGTFSLDGATYALAVNNRPNHLHGGRVGFDKIVWNARSEDTPDGPSLILTHLSPDGDEGYPGNLSLTVVYTLTNENGLRIDMSATTDRPTIVNLTHHSYFNLAGAGNGSVLDQTIQIDADHITAVDSTLIPTGELMPVEGTPFDFRTPRPIGSRIDEDHEQLQIGGGYDHNFVLNRNGNGALIRAARATDASSGRVMEVYTTEPGIQFYSGNHLAGLNGKEGAVYPRRGGFCLEPQRFPDSPNRPEFPSTVLRPGEEYRHTIEYRFSAE